jgi:hypothetical protein
MKSIRRRDAEVFLAEAARPTFLVPLSLTLAAVTLRSGTAAGFAAVAWAVHLGLAWARSRKRLFRQVRLHRAWTEVEDRSARFLRELRTARKRQIADLSDLPRNVESVRRQLYLSLRRADILLFEVSKSESGRSGPPAHLPPSDDPQAQELYRLADRHLAEYRRRYSELVSSAERTEAQAVVFVTMLDSLRVQLLQHRLRRDASAPDTREFLEAVTEAKMQLDAIDRTLEELELSPFPKTLTVVPDAGPVLAEESEEDRA